MAFAPTVQWTLLAGLACTNVRHILKRQQAAGTEILCKCTAPANGKGVQPFRSWKRQVILDNKHLNGMGKKGKRRKMNLPAFNRRRRLCIFLLPQGLNTNFDTQDHHFPKGKKLTNQNVWWILILQFRFRSTTLTFANIFPLDKPVKGKAFLTNGFYKVLSPPTKPNSALDCFLFALVELQAVLCANPEPKLCMSAQALWLASGWSLTDI